MIIKLCNVNRAASVCLSASVYPSTCLPVCPSIYSPGRLTIHLSVCPSVRLSVFPTARLPVCPSVRLSVSPSPRLPACSSIRLQFSRLPPLPDSPAGQLFAGGQAAVVSPPARRSEGCIIQWLVREETAVGPKLRSVTSSIVASYQLHTEATEKIWRFRTVYRRSREIWPSQSQASVLHRHVEISNSEHLLL